MAQIAITPSRQKLNTTVNLMENLELTDTSGTQVTSEAVSATEIAVPLVIESLPSDVEGDTGSITADSPGGTGSTIQLTALAGDVSNVVVGDLVFGINVSANQWNAGGAEDDPTQDTAGDEDYTAGQGNALATGAYVSAIDTGTNTIDITVGAGDVLVDQTARTGAELAFRRNGIKVTLAHVGVRVTTTGSNISLTTVVYKHEADSTDGASQDMYDNKATTDSTSNVVQSSVTINYDSFLSVHRVAKTNS